MSFFQWFLCQPPKNTRHHGIKAQTTSSHHQPQRLHGLHHLQSTAQRLLQLLQVPLTPLWKCRRKWTWLTWLLTLELLMSTYVIWLHASLVRKFQISFQHAWTPPPIPFPLPIVFGKILIRIFSPPGSVRLSSFAQQSWSSYRCGHWSVPRCHALRHVQRHHDLTPSTAPPAASQAVQLPACKVEKVASLHLANNHQLSKWYWSGILKRMKPSRQHSIKIKEKCFWLNENRMFEPSHFLLAKVDKLTHPKDSFGSFKFACRTSCHRVWQTCTAAVLASTACWEGTYLDESKSECV